MMDELYKQLNELDYRAKSATLLDPTAVDLICEIVECLKTLAYEVKLIQAASMQTSNVASCLANGIRPD